MNNDSESLGSTKGYANLIPPVKGERRNPNGRPKGSRNRSTIVRELLEAIHDSGRPNVEVATAAIVTKAIAGDVQAWDKLMDSGFGKIADKTELTGKDGGPVATAQTLSDADREILALHKQKIIDDYVKSTKGE